MKIKQILLKGFTLGIIIFFVSCIISLTIGEFIVKHTMPQETYPLARMVGLHIFEKSPILPFTLKKNVNKFHHIGYTHEFDHYVSTNSYSTRGREFSAQKPDKTYRILLLGDSMVFGWGVEDDQTYAAILEKQLNESRFKNYDRIEVINAGFTDGLTLDSYYLYYKEIGSKYNPDLVILNLFPYNDISELMDSTWEKTDNENLPTKIVSNTHKVEDGYLVSIKKTNWKFEVPLLRDFHLGILFMNAMEKGAPDIVKQIKKMANVSDLKDEITNEQKLECVYSVNQFKCPNKLWVNFEKAEMLLSKIQSLVKQNGQSLIVSIMPSPDQAIPLSEKSDRLTLIESVQPQKYFKDFLKEQGIIYYDLLPALTIPSRAQGFFYKQDGHLNQQGHKEVAQGLFNFIISSSPTSIHPTPAHENNK